MVTAVRTFDCSDREAVLNGDLAAILLSKKSSDNRSLVTALVGTGDVVGNL